MSSEQQAKEGRRSFLQWLHDLSLTTRLVTVVVGMTLMAYIVTTLLTSSMLRDYLVDRVDQDLRTAVHQLAESGPMGSGDENVFLNAPGETYVVTFRLPTGNVTTQTFGASAQSDTPALETAMLTDAEQFGEGFTVDSAEGDHKSWRVLVLREVTTGGSIAISTPMTRVDSTVSQVVLLISVIGICILMAVALISWFAVRRAFRPLTRIEDTARMIAAGDLTRRIPARGGRDEVASLSSSLNVMLTRIEQAFAARHVSEARMRRFVADASHELRTPLATVRGYAELYRVGGVRGEEDVTSAMRRIEDEATRMSRLVEDLLLLTRLDSRPSFERVPVDLTVLAADTVQDAQVRSPQRRIRLVPLEGNTGPVMTKGDDHSLRQVLTNLVGNAVAHTPDDTAIDIAVGYVDRYAVVEVRDRGPGIPPEVADRVFERFFRADASRSRDRGGTGLGLAIVAAIVGSHQGKVRYANRPGGGSVFQVALPAAPVHHDLDALDADDPDADGDEDASPESLASAEGADPGYGSTDPASAPVRRSSGALGTAGRAERDR